MFFVLNHHRYNRAVSGKLSHIDEAGRAKMVDVGAKPVTTRTATAEAFVHISESLALAIRGNKVAKGNILDTARLAGIQASKRTDELIPLCHSLPLDSVDIDLVLEESKVRITATARATARTGVEMEALTAASVAALTIYDMGKAIDRTMTISGIRLLKKTGGSRGDYSETPSPREGAGGGRP
ncbi:MAG: cyclic pyranopterin monophosphate synthase MoaC [Phycisphaerae bacterium]|nr:cyclic pyranopterin monophosphate synthase MoaC [Phycisphaerae bacterium]